MSGDMDWLEAMKRQGHMPKMEEDGSLDVFVTDYGYHNGPGCTVCYWTCCYHCSRPKDIPPCVAMEGTFTVVPDGQPVLIEGDARG